MHEANYVLPSNIYGKLLGWHTTTSKFQDWFVIENSGDKLIGVPNVYNSSRESFSFYCLKTNLWKSINRFTDSRFTLGW